MESLKKQLLDIIDYANDRNKCQFSYDVNVSIVEEYVNNKYFRHTLLINGVPCEGGLGETDEEAYYQLLTKLILEFIALNAHKKRPNNNE